MGGGPSRIAGEAFGGELDLFKPPPSMNLADEWTPTPTTKLLRIIKTSSSIVRNSVKCKLGNEVMLYFKFVTLHLK
jgi:hypothetical protein